MAHKGKKVHHAPPTPTERLAYPKALAERLGIATDGSGLPSRKTELHGRKLAVQKAGQDKKGKWWQKNNNSGR